LVKTETNRLRNGIALLFSIYFPPEPGGGSSAAWNRASILHKIGYSVFVICGFPSYPSGKVLDPKYKGKFFFVETLDSFTVIRLRLLPIQYTGYLRRLVIFSNFVFLTLFFMPKIMGIAGKINLVYSIAPIIFSSFIGFVYSKFTKSIFVYEVSDIWPEELTVFRTRLWFIIGPIGKFVANLSYIGPDIIIAIGNLAAAYISQEYRPKATVFAMPIGVDPIKFPSLSKDDCRMDLIRAGILPENLVDKFIILYSGLISNATRVENIAYAANKLKDEKDVIFLIVGDGEGKQNLTKLKSKMNLENFYLLAFQPRKIMPSIISAADACIVSLPPDPIFDVDVPTKFYEYLACFKPLIGISQGEVAEIINASNIGRTAKAGDIDKLVDIIKELKNSPALMETLKDNCSATLNRFSLDSLASSFLDHLNIVKSERHDEK
jgi:glycosyltransferase involved in cell wall biosynthesis